MRRRSSSTAARAAATASTAASSTATRPTTTWRPRSSTTRCSSAPSAASSRRSTRGRATRWPSSATFKKARETVGTDGLGFAYADPGRFFDLAAGAASGKAPGVDAAQLKMFKGLLTGSGLQSVAAKLDVASNALRIDAAAIGVKTKVGSGDGAGRGGRGAGGLVAERRRRRRRRHASTRPSSSLGESGATGGVDPATLLQGLQSQLGIDVQKDLLSWMGDAALFVRGTSMDDLGGALVVKSKDPAASRKAIGTLRKLLRG